MTRIAEIADRLHRLAKRREDEGIYTDAALCEEAAAYLSAALAHPLPLKEEVERVDATELVTAKRCAAIADDLSKDELFLDEKGRFGAELTAASIRAEFDIEDDDATAARALLSRIRAGAQEGWRSIETAPKDGSPFLAFGSYVYEGDTAPTIYMGVAEYSDEPNWPWRDAEGLHRETFYSHWMPLPAAPSPEAKGGRS